MRHSHFLIAAAAFTLLAGCVVEESELDVEGEELVENTAEAEQAIFNAKIWFTDGDGANVRSGPGTGFAVKTWLAEGTAIGIDCQNLNGTSVNGTTIWDYLPAYNGYVTDAYVLTGYDGPIPGVPTCGAGGGGGGQSLVVNGNVLNALEDKWVRWIATNTVPKLQGTRDERLTKASRVTWWSLKEGVLDFTNPNPIAYSNCNQQNFSTTYVCPVNTAWQAGIAGVQPRNHLLTDTQNIALALYPGSTISSILAKAATQAGYASGTATYNTIVNSAGDLRNSWLLRESATGFTSQHPLVYDQCVVNSQSWCYSAGWAESAKFAPNKSAALKSISDLKAILNTLAP